MTRRVRDLFASLTSRLVLTTVLLVLVVSAVIGTVTTLAVRGYLVDQLDRDVQQALVRAEAPDSFSNLPGGLDVENKPRGPGDEVGTVSAYFYPDYEPSGFGWVTEQLDSGRATRRPLSAEQLADLRDVPADGSAHRVEVDDLGSYRVAAGQGGRVIAGLPTADVDGLVSRLVRWEILLVALVVVIGGAAALLVVRRQLRPLREVAATAHTVSAIPLSSGEIELSERVPDHLTDERTEVGRVGAALNTLLAHVETSLAARHRSEQQVRQFVADASHELRSPLATIAGYTELARRRPQDAETVGTALDKVEEEAGRMTSLVEDLLLLARLDAGRPLERRPVDLTRLVVEAVSDARVLAPDHHWRVDVPDDAVETPYEVSGDPLRLHQVLTNLLTNARKYTPSGTTVSVTVRRDGFSVHDDGPGFPSNVVDHAFERFVRGDTARTRGGGVGDGVGVGLGLALVRAIVVAHGGTVKLSSVPGDTTVDVHLPG